MIELITLGRAAVLRDGTPLSVPPESPEFLLLVYLAADGPVPLDHARGLFWPHSPPDRADEELRATVAGLQELLGPDVVHMTENEIAVDRRRVDADVARFRRAAREKRPWDVVAIHEGPFLEGVDLQEYADPADAPAGIRSWVRKTRDELATAAELAHARMRAGSVQDDFWSRLARQVRSRSLVYATVLYLGFAGGAIQVSNVLIENTGLPDSAFFVVLALLVAGLPLVVGAVWILEELEGRRAGADPGRPPASGGRGSSTRRGTFLARTGLRTVHVVALLALLTLGTGTGWLSLQWAGHTGVTAAWAELPGEMGIAVLPFETTLGNGEAAAGEVEEALRAEITESVAATLARLGNVQEHLWVVPTAELRDGIRDHGPMDPAEAGRSFGVNLALSGRVDRSGDSLRVTMELRHAGEGGVLRTAGFSAPARDGTAIDAGIRDGLLELLDLELGDPESDLLASGRTEDARARDLYFQARRYLERFERREEEVESAIALFERGLERDPGHVHARAGLAEAYLRRHELGRDPGDLDRARTAVEEALELGDAIAPVHVTRGLIHVETGRYREALEAFRRALELEPHSAEARLGMARAYEGLGRSEEAERHYLRAVDLRPGYSEGHNQLGRFYHRTGRTAEAVDVYEAAVELVPRNHRLWASLGGLYYHEGEHDRAEDAFRRSLELRPNYRALSNLGTLRYYQGRYEEAVEHLEQAVALDDDAHYRVWGNLAAAVRRSGVDADDRVRRACRRAVELAGFALEVNPSNTDAMVQMAACYVPLDEPERARNLLRRALDEAPADVPLLFQAGDVHEDLGDRERAVALITEALQRGHPVAEFERRPGLADLRADPRIRSLVEELRGGLQP